jgi:hypothetical protein
MEYRVSGTFEVKVEAKDSTEAQENALIQVGLDVNEYLDIDTIICEEMEVKADLHRKYDLTNKQEDLILARKNE